LGYENISTGRTWRAKCVKVVKTLDIVQLSCFASAPVRLEAYGRGASAKTN